MIRVAFATLASTGYVAHAAGLHLNLRRVHPEIPLVVGALDAGTRAAFVGHESEGLHCVDAVSLWGAECWDNMRCRMTRPERAFASKPALAEWTLLNVADAVVLLDSDLLFLDRVDDLLARFGEHSAILVPGRHPIRDWSKAHRFGLFSAGIIGLSRAALPAVRSWKALCFDNCTAMPMTGHYYEQTYLDAFVNLPGVSLVHDDGINVSQTILRRLAPHERPDGRWQSADGVRLRVFHASRSSDTAFPLYQAKMRLNDEGLAHLGVSDRRSRSHPGRQSLVGRLVRHMHLGAALDRLARWVPRAARWSMESWRLLTVAERPLGERLFHARANKRRLVCALEHSADSKDALLEVQN